jgi:hypothetical protein
MINGVQYDSLPTGDSNTGSLSSFSLSQVEAGRTHPMLPPDEARLAASGPRTGGDAGMGKNDLTNLKLASNQQVSMARSCTERRLICGVDYVAGD